MSYTADEATQLVAYLHAADRSNKEIAHLLHTNQTAVSRYLKQAREDGLFVTIAKVPEEIIRRFEPFPGVKELEAAVRSAVGTTWMREVVVVPSQEAEEGQRRLPLSNWLAAAAARRLWYHARGKMNLAGVSWGRTLRGVARAAERLAPGERTAKVTWIPILGDLLRPAEQEAYSLSSSTLAADLTGAFGGASENSISLSIPAYIPGKFLEKLSDKQRRQRQQTIHDFIAMLPNYRLIFGPTEQGQKPLIDQLDTLVTSVGAPPAPDTKQPWWSLTQQLMEEEEALVQRATVGNLAGQFITHEEVEPEDERGIEQINARVFGPTIEAFKQLAHRSRKEETPGLIVVADGTFKAPVIARICQMHLVSELIIDHALALELLRLLDKKRASALQQEFGWADTPEKQGVANDLDRLRTKDQREG